LFALSALRFGFRLLCSDVKDPCKPLLFEHKEPIAAVIRDRAQWARVAWDNAGQMAKARDKVELKQLLLWQSSDVGIWQLKALKLSAGPSAYLLHDGRRTAAVRARLRLNRCSLNASLAERKITADPNCAVCAVPETVEHCLLDCPVFTAARQQCRAALDFLGLDLSFGMVLGAVESITPAERRRSALAATGHFLNAIDSVRRL